MAVSYKVVSKRPGGIAGDRKPKYFPIVTKRNLINTRTLAERISERSSFSTPDVIGMIESLTQLIPMLLKDGNNVRLDGLGTFSIHVSGVGRDDPEKVTRRDITKVKMAFLPSKDIKRNLATTEFKKA
ncbi:MAG: HU family DNA-binding protein [Cyclobacteriaceae bacterium]